MIKSLLHSIKRHLTQKSNYVMMATLFVLSMSPGVVMANDINAMQRQGKVELLAWVGEQPNQANSEKSKTPVFSVNEQVVLTVEVATPRWFTGGTRIGNVEMTDVIAKQRNTLATNYTARKNGETWSRQRWEITLYPQKSGEFVIPRLPVRVQVSAEDGEKVSGTLYTQPIKFKTQLPSGLLTEDTQWFSATSVDVDEQWQQSNDNLKVGDAITRTISIKAQDSLSVLLPNLLENESTAQYQAYPQPHKLNDTQERGDYRSERVEESVYVIQQGGDFTLPELTFQWWNTKEQRLETVVLDSVTFSAKHTFKSFIKAYSTTLIVVIALLAAMVVSALALKRYYQSRPTPTWLAFRRVVKEGDWSKIRGFVYRQLRGNASLLELDKCSSNENWHQANTEFQQGSQDPKLLEHVWQVVKKTRDSDNQQPWWRRYFPKALPDLDRKSR
ncbi:BatD family protein [Vibrio sp. D404a]|uniref:BatD family protein n=1 Tax=unclassified Vibrio TaxID=2614977 RepID=UPI00255E93E5|nr:BatD family protein [Vibrio sp. D404a]MDK9796467.1 BatD family protein [Vibrio sp. D449a]